MDNEGDPGGVVDEGAVEDADDVRKVSVDEEVGKFDKEASNEVGVGDESGVETDVKGVDSIEKVVRIPEGDDVGGGDSVRVTAGDVNTDVD